MATLLLDEKTHTYWLDKRKFDAVTKILEYLGLCHNYDGISPFYSERGKAVHKAVELSDKGTLDDSTVVPLVRPYVSGYRQFLKDTGYKPLYWEIPLCNEQLGYAGTLDKAGELNGRFGLLDIKTARSLDPAVELQLCAYALLWNCEHPERPVEYKYALQLTQDGKYNLVTKYSDTSVELWLSILETYKWKVKNRRF